MTDDAGERAGFQSLKQPLRHEHCFFPKSLALIASCSATHFTKLAEQCLLRLSWMKRHLADALSDTVA